MTKNPFSFATYAARRAKLMATIGQGNIALLAAAPVSIRNRDVEYPYRQDSYFMYLTGFPEPDALAVFVPEREQGEYLFFCRERDPEKEIWHGRRAGLEGACEVYGADDAFPIEDIDEIVPGLLENRQILYYNIGDNGDWDAQISLWLNQLKSKSRSGVGYPKEIMALDYILNESRLIKSEAEQTAIRTAVACSVKAHQRAMRACRAGLYEYQIEAELCHEFAYHGARRQAYPAIVASGANACILHYVDNEAQLQDGDLLLIDAGAEYQYYAADLTRTFPVNGCFSPAQKQIYDCVLAAQLAAIDVIAPDVSWDKIHQTAREKMITGLLALGLLTGTMAEILENNSDNYFFMHRTGHWLGMDVHDVGEYKQNQQWRALKAGMVLTVEPACYIQPRKDIDPKWWHIGVRIEDDVLVTATGHEVLSQDLVKTVAEIEALMKEGQNRDISNRN